MAYQVSVAVSVPGVLDLDALRKRLKNVQTLEKKPWQGLTEAERKKVGEKREITDGIHAIEGKSRLWFETEEEFKRMLDPAILALSEAVASAPASNPIVEL